MLPRETTFLVGFGEFHLSVCRCTLEANGCSVVRCDRLEDIHFPPEAAGRAAIVIDGSGVDIAACMRRVRARPETAWIPTLYLGASQADVSRAIAADVDDILMKPVRPRELLIRTRVLLQRHKHRAESIRNVDLLGEHIRVLGTVSELSQRLADTQSLEEIGSVVSEAMSAVTCCRVIALLAQVSTAKELMLIGARGLPRTRVGEFWRPEEFGLMQEVLCTRAHRVIQVDDPVSDRRVSKDFPASGQTICHPIKVASRTYGLLLGSDRLGGKPITPLDIEYIAVVARMAGAAIRETLMRQSRDDAQDAVVVALAQLAEYRDNETGMHLQRVTEYSMMLAQWLRDYANNGRGIDDTFLHHLRRVVPLHDIGKVAIPDRILLKPGCLTEDEMSVMRLHAEIGAATIQTARARAPDSRFLEMAEEIAHCHHEWFNGAGYPRGLAGTEIPLSARIAAIADVYDAVTSRRPYKEPMSHDEARRIIVQACGSQFDPQIVDAFVAVERQFKRIADRLSDDACAARPVSVDLPARAAVG